MKYCKSRQSALAKDRLYYKTGKPCSRGHITIRFAKTGRCVDCDSLNKINRYESIKLRTPKWANMDAIKDIYNRCKQLGADFHVDHIIPLHGDIVSGLHVIDNLQILHKPLNLKKKNYFDLDVV